MTSGNDQNGGSNSGNSGGVRHADPQQAAVDAGAAAQQDQVKADRDALQESAQRVDSSIPAGVRDTPVAQGNAGGAVDSAAAALQDQVRADHDALQASARRVESSVSADVRDTPIQRADQGIGSGDENRGSDVRNTDTPPAAVDADAAALQDRVKADHDVLQDSARRVAASVPAGVRDTPVQPSDNDARPTEDTTEATRNTDAARANADAARDSARRVEESTPGTQDRGRG